MKLQIVPASTGLQWAREGLRTFWRAPLAFGGLFLMFVTVTVVLSGVPWVGLPLAFALVPAATLGLMAATRQAVEGGFPLPATLVTAFRQSPRQTRAMLMLGALYAGAVLLIAVVTGWTDNSELTRLIDQYGKDFNPELLATDPAFQTAASAKMNQMLVAILLYTPVSVLLWHAPALVHWHGMTVGKSLFFSAVAVLRNSPAYLMYGIGWVAVASIGSAGLLVAAGMVGNIGIALAGTPLMGLLMTAMFNTSLWFTFRDSFAADAPPVDVLPPSSS
jgi:hypothetical protein